MGPRIAKVKNLFFTLLVFKYLAYSSLCVAVRQSSYSFLLELSKTGHSKIKIPLDCNKTSIKIYFFLCAFRFGSWRGPPVLHWNFQLSRKKSLINNETYSLFCPLEYGNHLSVFLKKCNWLLCRLIVRSEILFLNITA